MKIEKNRYLRNFVVASAGVIALFIAFLAFNLDLFSSGKDFIKWVLILVLFLLYLLLLKLLFPWIVIRDMVDGVWIGIALYCWSPIVALSWRTEFVNSLVGSILYFAFGIFVLILGYLLWGRRR